MQSLYEMVGIVQRRKTRLKRIVIEPAAAPRVEKAVQQPAAASRGVGLAVPAKAAAA